MRGSLLSALVLTMERIFKLGGRVHQSRSQFSWETESLEDGLGVGDGLGEGDRLGDGLGDGLGAGVGGGLGGGDGLGAGGGLGDGAGAGGSGSGEPTMTGSGVAGGSRLRKRMIISGGIRGGSVGGGGVGVGMGGVGMIVGVGVITPAVPLTDESPIVKGVKGVVLPPPWLIVIAPSLALFTPALQMLVPAEQ